MVTKTTTSAMKANIKNHFGLSQQQIEAFKKEEERIKKNIEEVNKVGNAKYQLESFTYKSK